MQTDSLTASMFLQVSVSRDFVAVRDEALKMIHSAFDLLHQEFQKVDGYILYFTWAWIRCGIAAFVLMKSSRLYEFVRAGFYSNSNF